MAANATSGTVTPRDFGPVAQLACSTPAEEYPVVFPTLPEKMYAFWCLDTTYVHAVLTQVRWDPDYSQTGAQHWAAAGISSTSNNARSTEAATAPAATSADAANA